MSFRIPSFFLIGLLLTALAITGLAQTEAPNTPAKTPKPTPTPKAATKITTADQAVENAIFLYGFPGGRVTLNQIRKTTLERGTSRVTNAEGKVENTNYARFVIRGESLDKEKIRLDQEFPSATYSLIYNDDRIFGVYNNTVFTPREDAVKTFENQIVRGIEALLRYKENESKIDLAAREKVMGVDYYVIDLTDKDQRKTRFYMSAKTFRVMMLTYEDAGVNYRRRFYDYNYAQGTLVPFQTILWADDKVVEDSEVGTITFGQKVDEQLFAAG
jgi:hypothetical protein